MTGAPDYTVMHYVGYNHDRGGIVSVVRNLAAAGRFNCVLGVGPDYHGKRSPPLATMSLPAIDAERLGVATFWRARCVARAARVWLQGGPERVFHAHSRVGLVAALWLRRSGERHVVASVHCLGRQRWFYRFAAKRLGERLYWLGPAMKRHYGLVDDSWTNCLPDCVPMVVRPLARPRREPGALRVGCAGGLVPIKQWELVLQATARLPASARTIIIHAGGEDETVASANYARELRRIADELGLAARVAWRGALPEDGMQAFHATIDVLVVPSRWEASSMAALEAVAAGVPVVASDAAGSRDLIESVGAGWLFRADDATDLAHRLHMLAESDALGALRIDPKRLEPFSADVVAAKWLEVYARLSTTR